MSIATLVAAFGLELDDAQLGAAFVGDNASLHGHPGQIVSVDNISAVDVQKRPQVDRGAMLIGQPLDEHGEALVNAVLLTARFDDRVHG